MNKGFTHLILLIVVLIIFAGAGVYFFSNKSVPVQTPVVEINTQESNPDEETSTSEVSPTQIPIPTSDDHVTFELEGKTYSLKKDQFPAAYEGSYSIYSVDSAFYSPLKNYITIFAYVGLTPKGLYYMDANMKNITFVELVEEASWSPDEAYIAFTSKPADAGPTQILKVYEVSTQKISEEYVHDANLFCYGGYSDINWINTTSFKVKYAGFDCPFSPVAKPTSEGSLTVSVSELLNQ